MVRLQFGIRRVRASTPLAAAKTNGAEPSQRWPLIVRPKSYANTTEGPVQEQRLTAAVALPRNIREEEMADGPTVVNAGGGAGTAIAIVVAIVAILALLFVTGVINLNGGDGNDINVKIDVPKVEAPASTPKPAAPAPAPANGG